MASPSFESYTFNKDYISVRKLNNKKQTGVAYVENERDIRFWDKVFKKQEHITYSVMPWGVENGKRKIESMAAHANERAVIAIDADYDHLCQGYREKSKITSNKYTIHTFSHSRESVNCGRECIKNVINALKRNVDPTLDIEEIINEYSRICFSVLPSFLFILNKNGSETNDENKIKESILKDALFIDKIKGVGFVNQAGEFNQRYLDGVREKARALNDMLMARISGNFDDEFEEYKEKLHQEGVNELTAFRYINGHALYNGFIIPLLNASINSIKAAEKSLVKQALSSKRKGESDDTDIEDDEFLRQKIKEIDNSFRDGACYKTLLNTQEPPMNDDVYQRIIQKVHAIHLP
ncbi:DUF4435 domain-containing protein [Plesiomonas shigelloides]|uniref:DUF4435 domain-containing protein n=1 Tax=Plesiomonas shigelloides TaxID=703 RepID=UPI00057B0113|nr:DUF4435 domain-containing protein [Plesiomonas shigelloides]